MMLVVRQAHGDPAYPDYLLFAFFFFSKKIIFFCEIEIEIPAVGSVVQSAAAFTPGRGAAAPLRCALTLPRPPPPPPPPVPAPARGTCPGLIFSLMWIYPGWITITTTRARPLHVTPYLYIVLHPFNVL